MPTFPTYEEHLIVTTDHELSPGHRIQMKGLIRTQLQHFGVTSVEHAPDPTPIPPPVETPTQTETPIPTQDHCVIFQSSDHKQDIVCCCGDHFRAVQFGGGFHPRGDALQQWVRHYNETKDNS